MKDITVKTKIELSVDDLINSASEIELQGLAMKIIDCINPVLLFNIQSQVDTILETQKDF